MATIRWCPIYPKWDIYQPLEGQPFFFDLDFDGFQIDQIAWSWMSFCLILTASRRGEIILSVKSLVTAMSWSDAADSQVSCPYPHEIVMKYLWGVASGNLT